MNLNSLLFAADGTKLALDGGEWGRPTARVWDLAGSPAAEPLLIHRSDTICLNGGSLRSVRALVRHPAPGSWCELLGSPREPPPRHRPAP